MATRKPFLALFTCQNHLKGKLAGAKSGRVERRLASGLIILLRIHRHAILLPHLSKSRSEKAILNSTAPLFQPDAYLNFILPGHGITPANRFTMKGSIS
jgi:hypothetical protein